MEYASKDLRDEHEGILRGLSILEKMIASLEKKGEGDIKDASRMVDFLKTFADKCHHGKEEGLYFPNLEKAGIPREGGPIGQMLLEHVQGRGYISAMAGALGGQKIRIKDFTAAARGYIDLLRAHIEKENNVLFALGDKVLPADLQASLLKDFESFEEQVMGQGTHEKLHALLEELEGKYGL